MKLDLNMTVSDYAEDLCYNLPCPDVFSIHINVQRVERVATISRPMVIRGCSEATLTSHFEIAHDSTWDDFGRAYYDSCNYQFTEFHCTLCSMDELRQQVETMAHQFVQDITENASCFIENEPECYSMGNILCKNYCNADLLAWIEDFKARNTFTEIIWVTDDHSCRPYFDTTSFQHRLAKLSLSVSKPKTPTTSRPRCRSYLMASCRQISGDDLLGH